MVDLFFVLLAIATVLATGNASIRLLAHQVPMMPAERIGLSWLIGAGLLPLVVAIVGPWMGATLLGLGWNFEQVLTALVIPAGLATAAVVIKGMVSHADAT